MVKRRSLAAAFLAASIVGAGAGGAHAQGSDDRSEARAHFEEGVALAEADRWPEALAAFRRSASLVPRASTSYNIANALYRLDRPVEALAELDEYDRMASVQTDPAAQDRGQALRSLVREAVGEVVLRVTPASATLFVDGWPSLLQGQERTLLLNPGVHFVRLAQEGYETHRQELRIERGSRQEHSIELAASSSPVAATTAITMEQRTLAVVPESTPGPAAPVPSDDRERFVKRPGFWVLIGVLGAAAIGAGVAVAVTRRDDSPSCGTTGTCATTQGLTAVSF